MYKYLKSAPDLNKEFLKNTLLKLYKKNISVTFLYININQFQIIVIVPNTITFDNVLDD